MLFSSCSPRGCVRGEEQEYSQTAETKIFPAVFLRVFLLFSFLVLGRARLHGGKLQSHRSGNPENRWHKYEAPYSPNCT